MIKPDLLSFGLIWPEGGGGGGRPAPPPSTPTPDRRQRTNQASPPARRIQTKLPEHFPDNTHACAHHHHLYLLSRPALVFRRTSRTRRIGLARVVRCRARNPQIHRSKAKQTLPSSSPVTHAGARTTPKTIKPPQRPRALPPRGIALDSHARSYFTPTLGSLLGTDVALKTGRRGDDKESSGPLRINSTISRAHAISPSLGSFCCVHDSHTHAPPAGRPEHGIDTAPNNDAPAQRPARFRR